MPRAFSVTFSAVAVTAAQDLFEITCADDKPVEIVGIELGQTSDSGDAQDEQIQLQIIRGNATSGSGGAAGVVAPKDPGDTISATVEVNNTTVASTGTPVTLHSTAWNVRAGYINWFPEGDRPKTNQGVGLLCVRMAAPVDSITLNGTLHLREL